MAKCALDTSDPRFWILGDASDTDLQSGLKELQDKVAKDHRLSNFFNQPMKHFPEFQNKVWKWDFAPAGESSSTRKGWRLYAYVPDPQAPEPTPVRAFLCYDKDQDPGGNRTTFIAGALKKFLAAAIKVQAVPERFRRQFNSDGRIVSLCYECFGVIFSADEAEADLAESAHECQRDAT